jgi:formyltetrahydrofolate-dependent phosphoribosylglycinamide formyltransferase
MDSTPRDPPITEPPIRLAVCVSGGGSTLQNLIDRIAAGRLKAEIVCVLASRPGIGAIERATTASLPCSVIARRGRTIPAFSHDLFGHIRDSRADLVILGGFLSLLEIPPAYSGRVINIHPSLIPAFCGQGMHGDAVHRAAIERGVKIAGCTVHFADNEYDAGPIILQRTVPVLDDDTPTTLATRVQRAESLALPDVITLYAGGYLQVRGRRVFISSQTPGEAQS